MCDCWKLEIRKWKLEIGEIGNWGKMKRVYELDVYKLAEALSDMVWHEND